LDYEQLRYTASHFARKAGRHTLQYFNQSFDLIYKDDQTPVTNADKEAEQLLRKQIQNKFPDHGILGEEYEHTNPDARYQWILDPIDGTRAFIHGVPLYTTLIGILEDGEPKVGIVYVPATDELCAASEGAGTYLNDNKVQARNDHSLQEATFLTTDTTTPAEHGYGKPFEELVDRTHMHRTWGNAYGHMMVATGRADIMFDPILNIWDAAPLITILNEAGGRFTDVKGEEVIDSDHGFISTTNHLYDDVFSLFND
jgi:myo-inositol-1(or 4)-monophosphatase